MEVGQVSAISFAVLQKELQNLAISIFHTPKHERKVAIHFMLKSCFQKVAKQIELGGKRKRDSGQSTHTRFFRVVGEELWQERTQEDWTTKEETIGFFMS